MKEVIKMNMIDFKEWLSAQDPDNIPYYNGGWVKKVTGVNKKYHNGYSIVGEFVEREGLFPYDDGLYIIKDIEGSRNHPESNYYLVRIENNDITVLKTQMNAGKDWAVNFWEIIEENLVDKQLRELREKAKQKIEKMTVKELLDFLNQNKEGEK